MLLTIATTHSPATDLGYLLGKHPDRVQTFPMSFGQAHVLYPQASESRCEAALLLDVDPVKLVRGKAFDQYVNDRPYVASSFLSVAIAKVFRTAMTGRCKDRPELANMPIPLTATLPVLPCRGGEALLRSLFEPLGYRVSSEPILLDEVLFAQEKSEYVAATLTGTVKLSELLSHLYVLIPVLDNEKHYWIGDEEVQKLLHHGEGWLADHPSRDAITRRYLKRRGHLARQVFERLEAVNTYDPDAEERAERWQAIAAQKPNNLNQQRLSSITQVLKRFEAKRVVDLGSFLQRRYR